MNAAITKTESAGSTRQRLLESSEILFSERGFDRVSVRDITEAASANVASVNYHFGSREGLVEQVMLRYINPVNEERIARLDALERKAGGKGVAVEELLDALVRPFMTQVRKSDLSEQLFYRLMGRVFSNESAELPRIVIESFEKVLHRFHKAFSKSLSGVDSEELFWRIHFTVGATLHTMAHGENLKRISRGGAGDPSMEALLTRLIRYAAAGLKVGSDTDAADADSKEGFLF